MKVTIFTSNQPRHLALVEEIASIADHVYVVQECNTVFPGQVKDFFNRSPTMQEYFSHVIEAEKKYFGLPQFSNSNTSVLSIKMGDLNLTTKSLLAPALNSDAYIIFGSSFIKSDLCDFLIQKKAINIHMGLSPFYRGSSCNFWALYDKRPDYVGSTVHLLNKGLDSGDILFHTLPMIEKIDPFSLGMSAVKSTISSLSLYIKNKENYCAKAQDKSLEIRYTRNRDFTDTVAKNYLQNIASPEAIQESLNNRDIMGLITYPSLLK